MVANFIFGIFGPTFCTDIFGTGGAVGASVKGGVLGASITFTGILSASIMIILAIISILAVAYGIGKAFHIKKIVDYSTTEFFEGAVNLGLIIILFGSIAAINSMTSFVSNTASVGLSSVITTPVQSIADSQTLYNNICTNYLGFANDVLKNVISNYLTSIGFTFLSDLKIMLAPNGVAPLPLPSPLLLPGFTFIPWGGLFPIIQILNKVIAFDFLIFSLYMVVIMVLYIIYNLFPIFLYFGIILRSFPWTRSAGGAFMALFISFFVIFPALLYPFTSFSPGVVHGSCVYQNVNTCIDQHGNVCVDSGGNACVQSGNMCLDASHNTCLDASGSTCLQSGSTPVCASIQPQGGLFTSISAMAQAASGIFAGSALVSIINSSLTSIIFFSFELLGMVIAFLVSFDMVEMLGHVLGSPSIKGEHILHKLI